MLPPEPPATRPENDHLGPLGIWARSKIAAVCGFEAPGWEPCAPRRNSSFVHDASGASTLDRIRVGLPASPSFMVTRPSTSSDASPPRAVRRVAGGGRRSNGSAGGACPGTPWAEAQHRRAAVDRARRGQCGRRGASLSQAPSRRAWPDASAKGPSRRTRSRRAGACSPRRAAQGDLESRCKHLGAASRPRARSLRGARTRCTNARAVCPFDSAEGRVFA